MSAAAEIERLAASDRSAWKRLEQAIARGEPSPPELINGMIAALDPRDWIARLRDAYSGPPPESSGEMPKVFTRWLAKGIVRHVTATDLPALSARFLGINHYEGADASARAGELVDAIGENHRDLLGRALLLQFRHLANDGDFVGALAAAERGCEVFAALGNEHWHARAVRNRASALLRLGRIDEALALTDSVADLGSSPYCAFEDHGGYVYLRASKAPDDPVEKALHAAASSTLWATRDGEHWIEALGALAVLLQHPGCIERYAVGKRILEEKKAREHAQWLLDQEEIDKLPGPMR